MSIKNKIIEKFKIGNIFKNVSWILIQNIYTMVLGLILTGFVARHFGAEGYGYINFASSFIALFSFIAIFGTNHIIMKDLSENKINTGIVLGSNLLLRIILSIIALVISQSISLLFYDSKINILILLFNINTILCSFDILVYFAQSRLQNKWISISKIISVTFFSIFKIVVLLLNLSIEYYVLTYILETIIYSILLFISYKKIKKNDIIKWQIDKSYIWDLLKKCKYYAISSLMVTIYLRIDQVMLGSMFNDKAQVGIYSAAVRISDIWTFVPLSIITAYKPVIINSRKAGKKIYEQNLSKIYNIVSFVCFIFVVGIFIFGKLGINILYGNEYLHAYLPLIILTIGIWIGVLGNIHFIWMMCEDKEKYSMFYSFCGSVVNVILNLILIPKCGIVGASIATLISQIFSNIISFLIFKETKILSKMIIKSLNVYYGFKDILSKINNK